MIIVMPEIGIRAAIVMETVWLVELPLSNRVWARCSRYWTETTI
jgi:hypothetical protein